MNDSEQEKLAQQKTTEAHTRPVDTALEAGAVAQPDDLHDLLTTTDEEDPLSVLRNDPNYSALIRDLEYIAKQARMLFEPAQDSPSDAVWTKIQSELANKQSDS